MSIPFNPINAKFQQKFQVLEGGEEICIFFTVNGERKGVNDGTKSTDAVEEGRDSDPANNNTNKGAVGAQKNSHEIA